MAPSRHVRTAQAPRIMKPRAANAITEYEVLRALEADGQPVTPAQLSDWRKEGLLPPLSSHGRGAGGGRQYYWNQAFVLEQARCVRDLLARHGRHSTVILVLWLCGYPVSTLKARRAWLQRAKRPRTWLLRDATRQAQMDAVPAPLALLMHLCGSFRAGHRTEAENMYASLEQLGEALGLMQDLTEATRQNFFTSLSMVLAAIEDSSILDLSREADMDAARHLTQSLVDLAQPLISPAPQTGRALEQVRLMEAIGAPVFLCALLLLRTGYRSQIAATQDAIKATRPSRAQAMPDKGALARLRTSLLRIWRVGTDAAQSPAPIPRKQAGAMILAMVAATPLLPWTAYFT